MRTGALHTEQDLVTRLKTGDEQAFTELYNMHYARLYFFALRYLTDADAKDVVVETFIQLWNKHDSFDSPPAMMRFLFLAVKNKCLNVIRHTNYIQRQQAELLLRAETSREEDLTNEALTTELIGIIHEEIDKLPQRVREIFLLSFVEGLKPSEIAERLQLSVQTVKNQKVTALRLLQAAVGPRSLMLYLFLVNGQHHSLVNPA